MVEARGPLPLIDRLGELTHDRARGASTMSSWDAGFVCGIMPILDGVLAYFDAEVEHFDRIPSDGPVLVVGNHSGGMYMPDYWAFLRRWVRVYDGERPLHPLGFDLLFALPGIASLVPRIGVVPASHDNGAALLAAGHAVLVYPGGDADAYRPWAERHRVDLHGHAGFVRLALRAGVPVVPMVSHGSHDVMFVAVRGEALARRLGLDRVRVTILPFVVSPPWGLVPILPLFPLPAKLTVRVCEPMDWHAYPPEAADDPAIVRHCYEEVLGRMQANLDELVVATPHPIAARLLDPLRRGSGGRATRP